MTRDVISGALRTMKLALRAVVKKQALGALALAAIVNWASGSLYDVLDKCCDVGHDWFDVNHESCSGYTSSVNGVRPNDRAACNSLIQICCLSKRQQRQCTEGKDTAKTGDDCGEWLSQPGSEDARSCCECCNLGITAHEAGLPCSDFEDQFEPVCDAAFQDCCESGRRDIPTSPSTPIVSSNASSSERCWSSSPPCQQRCSNSGGTVQCSCFDGYALDEDGRSCNDVNECVGRGVCGPGQVCVNTQGSYRCQGEVADEGPVDELEASTQSVDEPGPPLNCGTGFTPNRRSGQCEDINECALNHDTCVEGQTCENSVGSFMCRRTLGCGTGYTLDQASQKCNDVDECLLDSHNCGVARECVNIPGSFRCVSRTCPRGYQLDFRNGNCNPIICPRGLQADDIGNCIDIDECLERPNVCRSNQECRNTIGSYTCRNLLMCSSGYELNEAGTRCEDIDECQTGTHECQGTLMQCINRPGTYSCQCPEGYQINHALRICEDLDECHYSGHACAQNARCENTYGSYRCNCKDGFMADQNGRVCNDIDECQQSEMCQQTCQNTWGSFHCLCEQGYRLASDGRSCEDVDECQQAAKFGIQICIGLCENTHGSFACVCPPGYQLNSDGHTCQDVNECAMQTANCAHHSDVCLNTRGGYKCQSVTCPNGFTKSPLTGNRNSNVRCQRKTFVCAQGDLECLYAPLSYSTNFITFPMQIRTPADLFTMRGPLSSYRRLGFDLKLISAQDPRTGEARVDRGYFALHQLRSNEAVIQLLREVPGPQDIELQLDMNIYSKEFGQNSEEIYFGTAVARIFIYVTKDSW